MAKKKPKMGREKTIEDLMVQEPVITINGHQLTPGQAMTVRSAINSYAWTVRNNGISKGAMQGQLEAINEINEFIMGE
jgi:hypothetical protein